MLEPIYVKQQLAKNLVEYNDVAITRSGANYGQTACYKYEAQIFACADVLIVKRSPKISSGYLSTYLNTKYGKFLIERGAYGMAQPHIAPSYLNKLTIPRLNKDFEFQINTLLEKSFEFSRSSREMYENTEDLLLSELGLKDWQPTEENVAVKSFASSFGVSDRLDAEYYQPKQQKVMSVMRQSGLCIKDIADLEKSRFQPKEQGAFNYIEIGNVSGEGFVQSEIVAVEDAPSRAQWIVKTNDVITSTVRPIRRLTALIGQEQNNYICSSGFAVLKPSEVESEVLLVYLRLPVICEILDLHTTASMYPAISTEDL